MKRLINVAIAAASIVACASVAQAAETVATPGDTQGWTAANVNATGSVAITGAYKPAGETGSLQFTTTNGAGKADYRHLVNGTLGDLANNAGAALSYDYLVAGSSATAAHLAPALRLAFNDQATGHTGYLVWEPIYNGVSDVTNDTFVANNILDGNFWMRAFGPSRTIERFDVSLDEWATGASYGTSWVLSADTLITAIEVGVGSGWGGAFDGAVDHVNLDFGRAGTTGVSTDFELTASGAVPEPATWAMMILGLGAAGSVIRRRRMAIAA